MLYFMWSYNNYYFFFPVGAVTITTFPQTVRLKRGELIILPCFISGKDFDLFTNPLIWYKEIENGYKQINTNIQISEPFKSTKRYKVVLKRDGNNQEPTIGIPLTIKGNCMIQAFIS